MNPPHDDMKALLGQLSLGSMNDKLAAELARQLGKADFLAMLNDVGVSAGPRYKLAAAIFGEPLATSGRDASPGPSTPPARSSLGGHRAHPSAVPPPNPGPPPTVATTFQKAPIAGVKLEAELAKSGQATVYRGSLQGEVVAVKLFHTVNDEASADLRTEMEALQRLRHKNVILLIAFAFAPLPCLVTPFLANGDLRSYLKRNGAIENLAARSMALGIARGLRYVHEVGIIHRDLKSPNIFLTETLEPLIGDFGSSRFTGMHMLTNRTTNGSTLGTPQWMAPEMIRGEQYSNSVDVYSFGVILWEILDGSLPYSERNFISMELLMGAVLRGDRPRRGAKHTGVLAEMMEACWSEDASKRPNSERLVRLLDTDALPVHVVAQSDNYPWANGHLSFKRGDKITVASDLGEGWWVGELNGKRGLFPSVKGLGAEDVKRMAERGEPAAQVEFAQRCRTEDAVPWYRKAAAQGSARGQYNLGVCYEFGRGVTKDEHEAVLWYCRAAEQSDADAQCSLGVCSRNGRGLAKDEREAVTWYRKAADQGHGRAQYNLGVCYEYGRGVQKNEVEAVAWYRKAADLSNNDARCALGVCYEAGIGVSKDTREAVTWYRKGAEAGHPQSQGNLGVCYESGTGLPKDTAQAVVWYRRAAQQGHARSHAELKRLTGEVVIATKP